MKNRIWIATICLQIITACYALLGLVFFAGLTIPSLRAEMEKGDKGPGIFLAMLVICVVAVIGIEVTALGLHRRRFWAWIAALCIFAIYLPSPLLPLGALGLWGLLSPGSRAQFGVNATAPMPNPQETPNRP